MLRRLEGNRYYEFGLIRPLNNKDFLYMSRAMNDIKNEEQRTDKCQRRWCTSNLPATHSIPSREGSTIYVQVCDNCYYDYKYEGIQEG